MNQTRDYLAFDQCQTYPLPEGRLLVRNPRNGRHALLTPDVHAMMQACRVFRTLEDHVAHLVSLNPALKGEEAALMEVLQSVRNDGLMLSADIYTITLQPAAPPRFNVDKPVAAVITWERPEALARCLASVTENCELSHLARFLVIDDSRSEAVQQLNREHTQAFADNAGIPVTYLGAAEQRGFMEAIIRQVPALETQIRFLIDRDRWADHWTSGLARTVALLLSVGKRLLVLDDDILCEVFEPERQTGVRFADSARQARFYEDPSDWEKTRAETAHDPFLRHLRFLGSNAPDAIGALGLTSLNAADFAGARLDHLERLDAESRVLITECGSMGDPGTSNVNWLASLRGDSLDQLLNSEEAVERALSARFAWHGRRRAHLLPRSNMSQLTGLDHRSLLPPYIPILRGEDRLFGDMVEFIHPKSLVLDQSWCIAHLPIPPRTWTGDAQRFDTAQPFPRFVNSLVEQSQERTPSTEPVVRLAHLARLYEGLTERNHQELQQLYEDRKLAAKVEDYGMLKEAREAAGQDCPERWQAFLDDALTRLNRELVDNPVDATLKGYPKGLEGEALTDWWLDFWRQFAQSLRAWPAIRQAARNVKI